MAYYSRPRSASTKPFDYRAKGDIVWLQGSMDFEQETTRSAQEQLVWGAWGEPRLSNSDRLGKLQDYERQHEVDAHGRFAAAFLHHGTGVGHSPALAHAPIQMAPGSRVGEHSGGHASQLDIRTAAGDLNECMEYIAAGYDLNARDTCAGGFGILHYAAKWDRVAIIELCLNHGADTSQRDFDGKTPGQIAEARGNYCAARLLSRGQTSKRLNEPCWRTGVRSAEPAFEALPYRNLNTGARCMFHEELAGGAVVPPGVQGSIAGVKNEVLAWLDQIGMGRHAHGFIENGMSTMAQLRDVANTMTRADLQSTIGILDTKEQSLVWQHCQALNRNVLANGAVPKA